MTRSTFPDVEIPNLSIYDFLFGSLEPEELEVSALVDGTSGAKTTTASWSPRSMPWRALSPRAA